MTIPLFVLVVLGLAFLILLLAYIGAAERAAVLQATVDQLWPVIQAVGRAIYHEGTKDCPAAGSEN